MYKYVYDSQGNVSMIVSYSGKEVICMYEYDSYGNSKVYDNLCQENTKENFIGNVNPFRWKGFYLDIESNLYYIKGNYYDPETGLYVNATSIENAINSAYIPRSLDRNGLLCNNTIELSSTNTQENLYTELIPVHTQKMLKALPWYTTLVSTGIDFTATFAPVIEKAIWGASETGRLFTDFYYAAYGINRFDALNNLRSPLGKISQSIGFVLIALDLGLNIYNSVQQDYSLAQGITSFTLTAIKDIGVYFLSASVARAVGAKIGAMAFAYSGPVGMAIGFVVGAIVGAIVNWLGTMFIDWIVELID